MEELKKESGNEGYGIRRGEDGCEEEEIESGRGHKRRRNGAEGSRGREGNRDVSERKVKERVERPRRRRKIDRTKMRE